MSTAMTAIPVPTWALPDGVQVELGHVVDTRSTPVQDPPPPPKIRLLVKFTAHGRYCAATLPDTLSPEDIPAAVCAAFQLYANKSVDASTPAEVHECAVWLADGLTRAVPYGQLTRRNPEISNDVR